MTANPRTLQDLGAYWSAQGGVNLGVVGNQKHCGGYHLGKDRLFGTCACKPDGTCVPGKGWDDYSVKTTRDRRGLSNSASAIDLGRLGGSLQRLFDFSSWLAQRCLDNAPGTADVREIVYSPDGRRVLGFKDGIAFLIPGYGDLSHLTHTHISFYRDSELRDKRLLFSPYFDLPDSSTEASMIEQIPPGVRVVTIRVKGTGHSYLKLTGPEAGKLEPVAAGFTKTEAVGPVILRKGTILGDSLARRTGYVTGLDAAFFLAVDLEPPTAVVDCTDAVEVVKQRVREAIA